MMFVRHQPQPLGILWISPDTLSHRTTSGFMSHLLQYIREKGLQHHAPFVIGGAWDRELSRLDDMDSHHAFFQRYSGTLEFRQTAYYQRISRMYKSGRGKSNSLTVDDWERRVLERYDAIFRSIKEQGFKTQEEIGGPFGIAEEIAVCIGRKGEYLFLNGKHRLAMAKALKLERIPIVLVAVHRAWRGANDREKLGK